MTVGRLVSRQDDLSKRLTCLHDSAKGALVIAAELSVVVSIAYQTGPGCAVESLVGVAVVFRTFALD